MLTKDRHFCELFAGKAAVSTAMRAVPCCSNYVCRFVKLLNSNPNRNAGPPKPASSLEADFVGTSMDINLSSAFDMLTAAGMSFLVLVSKLILLVGSSTTRPTTCGLYTPMVVAIYDPKSNLTATVKPKNNLTCFGLDFVIHTRLAINELLRCVPGGLVILAPVCTSFSRMCREATILS